MKRLGIAGIGAVFGFVTALVLLPAAQGAPQLVSVYRQLDLFGDAFERVRANYVREVEDTELIDAAINGMVSALDPHSSYMDAKEFADMQVETRGEFTGLGLEVTVEEGLVKVVSPIDDTPGARAGIKAGDFISDIDGQSVQGMPLNEAVAKMRGPQGSRVTLTILRKGERRPFDVTLTRATIRVANVKWRREGDVGYIRITQFISERTASEVQNAVRQLKQQIGAARVRGYVVDLRNNPGGLLDQSVDVADIFLNGGEVVSTRGRRPGDTQRYNARGGDLADGKPVTVLINEGTASASEIVAGALQDHRRATVLGMTSFGKGSVQTIIPLSGSHGALRLTTAKYYTPSGRSIQAAGIIPDIAVSQLSAKDDADERFLRSESELPGHLAPEAQRGRRPGPPVIRPDAGKTYEDFQLSYALDRMNGRIGMPVAQSRAPAPAAAPAPRRQ